MKLSRLNMAQPEGQSVSLAPQQVTAAQPSVKPASVATEPQPIEQKPVDTAPQASSPASLSIKNLMKKASEAKVAEQEENTPIQKIEFNEANVKVAWMELAKSESGMPRLASAISQADPCLDIENKTIVFKVGNAAQKDWIDKNCRIRLESFIQRKLNDKDIRMNVEVLTQDVIDNEKKLYMPSQKADYLKENSQEFRELSKDLDLETA